MRTASFFLSLLFGLFILLPSMVAYAGGEGREISKGDRGLTLLNLPIHADDIARIPDLVERRERSQQTPEKVWELLLMYLKDGSRVELEAEQGIDSQSCQLFRENACLGNQKEGGINQLDLIKTANGGLVIAIDIWANSFQNCGNLVYLYGGPRENKQGLLRVTQEFPVTFEHGKLTVNLDGQAKVYQRHLKLNPWFISCLSRPVSALVKAWDPHMRRRQLSPHVVEIDLETLFGLILPIAEREISQNGEWRDLVLPARHD